RVRRQRAARCEQRLGDAQVRPHAEIEVRLAFPADRRREVEDHIRRGQRVPPAARRIQQITEVTAGERDPLVAGQVIRERRGVQGGYPGEWPCPAAAPPPRPPGQRPPGTGGPPA